jgi:uncharacterized protein YjlB
MTLPTSPAGVEVDVLSFDDARESLTHPALPAMVYRAAIPTDAAAAEALFTENCWGGVWRNGIYGYAHYHSNAHEVLGVVHGAGTVRIGGDTGRDLDLCAGDVMILPAGTGHQLVRATGDFLVVGAYPRGQEERDIQKEAPDEILLSQIASVPLPKSDPVFGEQGPIFSNWPQGSIPPK